MADKKKGLAALIIAKAKPEEKETEPAPMPDMEAKMTAAEELMDALNSGDPMAVVEAFSSLQELCRYSEPDME